MTMIRLFDRSAALEYARKWALLRNPAYYDFDPIGGDCTNFISQCIFAGAGVMNYTPDVGWYYSTLSDRAAAWTSVKYIYRFLTQNLGAGPFAEPVSLDSVLPGDIIQLGTADGDFYHSCITVALRSGMPFIAAHTNDVYDVPLSAYRFGAVRCLRIKGVRYY